MKKTSRSVSLTLVLAIMLLACLLFVSFGQIGAWFSEVGPQVEIVLNIDSPDNLVKVYQYRGGQDVLIDADADEPTYIQLENTTVIKPDVEVPVNLKIKTADTHGFHIKFRFKVLTYNGTEDIEIKTENTYTEKTESQEGFVLHDNDKYYYYRDTNNNLLPFKSLDATETSLDLIASFKIPFSEFETNNFNGETIKIMLTVECMEYTN